ncbi:hypothetical protein TRFO_22819 [Tritrichomonas foetus]|uniref:Uncharacterized protein n=1 Tax=Tritrichomonas foetus TaxID=1144522 RepID=A0A1J4KGV6_9EUKA|nr:hypothetical protein TRFO_22819 [Tritrichomonas foetus]|eukprot:OHT08565.1 hypothetical protein TRFO_22819 [Tritrichomonas foetus]
MKIGRPKYHIAAKWISFKDGDCTLYFELNQKGALILKNHKMVPSEIIGTCPKLYQPYLENHKNDPNKKSRQWKSQELNPSKNDRNLTEIFNDNEKVEERIFNFNDIEKKDNEVVENNFLNSFVFSGEEINNKNHIHIHKEDYQKITEREAIKTDFENHEISDDLNDDWLVDIYKESCINKIKNDELFPIPFSDIV